MIITKEGCPSWRIRIFLVAMALLLTIGNFGFATAQDAEPTPGGRLVFASNTEPNCFDPQISAADATSQLVRTVVDSLIAQVPSGELVPWLATSWTVNDTVTQFTFELQTGITFSDGTPFDAEKVLCFRIFLRCYFLQA